MATNTKPTGEELDTLKAEAKTARARITTPKGDICFRFYPDDAPQHTAAFIKLARNGFYDGLSFHRVEPGFVIQGGDPSGNGTGGPGYRFKDEIHPELAFTKPYLLAMANAGPGTNGSQFFITVGKTPHLNRKHTIFGEVVDPDSQKVVDAIGATATGAGGRPTEAVVIDSITVS